MDWDSSPAHLTQGLPGIPKYPFSFKCVLQRHTNVYSGLNLHDVCPPSEGGGFYYITPHIYWEKKLS